MEGRGEGEGREGEGMTVERAREGAIDRLFSGSRKYPRDVTCVEPMYTEWHTLAIGIRTADCPSGGARFDGFCGWTTDRDICSRETDRRNRHTDETDRRNSTSPFQL